MSSLFRQALIFALCALLSIAAAPAQARSPVWQIEKNGRLMFIGGTLHLLTPEDYPLPDAFEKAYRQSSKVVFETDLERFSSPEFQQYVNEQLSYRDGRDLRQVLSEDTYRSVAGFFEARGVPMSGIDRFKPGMVAMLMTLLELRRIGVVAVGVDDHFSSRLAEDGKAKGKLETAEQQVAFIANMGAGDEDAMLAYNLADLRELSGQWRAMTSAWRNGDMPALEAIAATPLRDEFPEIYRALVPNRNDAWMPKIEAFAQSQPVELLLVGALHLVGEDGLLAALAERGYSVRQLP
jgi:uncharacterized protein YbaP (TraB family)